MNANTRFIDLKSLVSPTVGAAHPPAVSETPVKVLFPHLQLAIVVSLLLSLLAPTAWTTGLFCTLLLVWQVALSLRLALESWRPSLHICSTQAAQSVMASVWYGMIGVALELPVAAVLAGMTMATLALYGWVCRGN